MEAPLKPSIQELLKPIPRVELSILPTPIVKLDNLSKDLNINLYCMRDDMTGFALGGNKTRKLDYLIADALSKGCDSIIAVGANQSNFCRMAAGAARKYGLEPYLVLKGEQPQVLTGNLLIDHLFGATIIHTPPADIDANVRELKDKLELQGKKVYYMHYGGSSSIGALGYVKAFEEIVNFTRINNIHFKNIFHSSSSSGTQTGLVVGQAITDYKTQIIGVSADIPENVLIDQIYNLSEEIREILGTEVKVEKAKIQVEAGYIGEGYGLATEGGREAISMFARREGIILDEVYTGKAAAGLIDYARKGLIDPQQPVLFIYTGGFIQLFH